jgi:hypothetical protein
MASGWQLADNAGAQKMGAWQIVCQMMLYGVGIAALRGIFATAFCFEIQPD